MTERSPSVVPKVEGPRLAGVVLCGGVSSRMGTSKALLAFEGEPLVARVAGRLLGATCALVVVAAEGQELPALPAGVIVARDRTPQRGPLEGVRAGLEAIAFTGAAAFVATTDAPFVDGAFSLRLEVLREEAGADAAIPRVDGRTHPLTAVYAPSVLAAVAELLARGQSRVSAIADVVRVVFPDRAAILADPAVAAADPELLSLVNVNTPADYAAAVARRRGR